MKKIHICIAFAILLSGCKIETAKAEAPNNGVLVSSDEIAGSVAGLVKLVTLEDGTRCAVLIGTNKGAIDCSWKNDKDSDKAK